MEKQYKISIFWFRRDLRLNDNAGLYQALKSGNRVLPLFIFDRDILDLLEDKKDKRVDFIHQQIQKLQGELLQQESALLVKVGRVNEVFKSLAENYTIESVYCNHDYEPKAILRDNQVNDFLKSKSISFNTYKDQVIFEKGEVVKDDQTPYTVFTPYMKRWKAKLNEFYLRSYPTEKYFSGFLKWESKKLISLKELGFEKTQAIFPLEKLNTNTVKNYHETRDIPGVEGTSKISLHLRFGTVSVRNLMRTAKELNEKWWNELNEEE